MTYQCFFELDFKYDIGATCSTSWYSFYTATVRVTYELSQTASNYPVYAVYSCSPTAAPTPPLNPLFRPSPSPYMYQLLLLVRCFGVFVRRISSARI